MFPYLTPGVYFEWLDKPPELKERRTDIVGFVGISRRGPLHQPQKVESWAQFASTFGGHTVQGFLAYAVEGFFANGGLTCWIVRVADPDEASPAYVPLQYGQATLLLQATSPGIWGQKILVRFIATNQGRFTLQVQSGQGEQELWRNITLEDPDDAYYIKTVLNRGQGGSGLVRIPDEAPAADLPAGVEALDLAQARVREARLTGGADGLSSLSVEHLTGNGSHDPNMALGLQCLETVDEVSVVAIPDIMQLAPPAFDPPPPRPRECDDLDQQPSLPPALPQPELEFVPPFTPVQVGQLQRRLIQHCAKLKDRMAILDTWPDDRTPDEALARRLDFDSKYAALYYPWLMVSDPLRPAGSLRRVPPSGHVAGIYARVSSRGRQGDRRNRRGVHQPPANEMIEAAQDVAMRVGDIDHGRLNSEGVNVIRPYNGRGIRVAGARMTVESSSEWRYVNVRRLLMMIEEAIDEQLQWTVFEPGNQALWRDIDRVVRTFLDRLWRQGMLDGATAEEAYRVVCDETTNPPEVQEQGRVICELGVLPPWPAEFVVVRIGKTENTTEIMEG